MTNAHFVRRWGPSWPRDFAFPAFDAHAACRLLPVPDFWITQSNYIGLYSAGGAGPGAAHRRGGLTSFGQAAFVGIGAYTTAWLATLNTACRPGSRCSSAWAGGATALLVGLITLRMSGHYLPLATIAWGLVAVLH
jgi:branched-chain amino acid transport system permease protein